MHPNNTGSTIPKPPFSSGRYTRFQRRLNNRFRGHPIPTNTNSIISFNSRNNNPTKAKNIHHNASKNKNGTKNKPRNKNGTKNKPKNKNGTKTKTIKNHTSNLQFREEKMKTIHTKIPPSQ